MAIQSFQLDPNAVTYTDDEIVGKVNAATANITRAGSIEGTAASGLDSDDIGEGATNLYDTGVPPSTTDDLTEGTTNLYDTGEPPTDDEVIAQINSATDPITREAALSQDDLMLVKTNPVAGEFQVKNIQRDSSGELDVEYDDVAES